MSSTVRLVRLWSVLSLLRRSRTMCRVTSTGVFVKSKTTSWEMRISSASIFMLLISCASSLEFLQWCFVSPRRGLIISTSAFDKLYETEPVLSTMGRNPFYVFLRFHISGGDACCGY